SIEGTVERRIRQWSGPVRDDRRDFTKRLEGFLGLIEWAGPMHNDKAQGVTVPVFGNEGQRRGDLKTGKAAELLGRVANELVEHSQHRGGVLQVVEDRPCVDLVDLG